MKICPFNLLAWRGPKRLLFLVLLTLVPALVLVVLYQLDRQRQAVAGFQAQARQLSQHIAERHVEAVSSGQQLLYLLAQLPEVRNLDAVNCQALFAATGAMAPAYTQIALADENGKVLAASGVGPDDVGEHRFFRSARMLGQFSVGELAVDRRNGLSVIHLGQPVYNDQDQFVGVVFVGLDMGILSSELTTMRLPAASTLTVCTAKGVDTSVLYRWPDTAKWVGKPLKSELLTAIGQDGEREELSAKGDNGKWYLYAYRRYRLVDVSGDLIVLVGIPEAPAMSLMRWGFIYELLAAMVVGTVLVAALWHFGNQSLLERIRKLVAATQAVARGDLRARTGIGHEDDDVGAIAKAVDSMTDALAQRDQDRQVTETIVLARSRQLRVLSQAARRVNTILEVPAVLRQVVDCARDLTGATCGAAGLKVGRQMVFQEYNKEGTLVPLDQEFAPGHGVPGWVLDHGETYLTNDAANDPQVVPEIREALGYYNLINTPIFSHEGELLGCFEVHNKPTDFTPADVELLRGLAASAAIAIENSQMIAERKENEDKYRLIVENQTDMLVKVDAQGRIQFVSPSYCRVFGLREETLVGQAFAPLVHPDDKVATEAAMSELHEPPYSCILRQRAMTPTGWRWFEWSNTSVRDAEGNVTAIIGVGRDISERKVMEQALARAKETAEGANRAKDRFLATLSHELRTPLTPVLATLSILQQTHGGDATLQQDLTMMRRSVELESRLIDDLLDHTRIARGKMRLDLHVVDAHELLRRAIAIATEGTSATLAIDTELSAGEHMVFADPARLQQVFWNIVKNAMQYTPEGGRLSIQSHNAGSGQIEVSFTDTGIGIDPAFVHRVFDAFEQGEASAIRPGGLGLGLAISRSIMQALNGNIEAASAGRGKGSTFTVRLPTCTPETIQRTPSRTIPGEVHALRILLVEDHAVTLKVMARILEAHGHSVVSARSVASAIDAARANAIDLLISDIGLPDGSGLEIMQWLREHQNVPGIALSGYGMEADQARSREAGFRAHLVKPVVAEQLLDILASVLNAPDSSDTPAPLESPSR